MVRRSPPALSVDPHAEEHYPDLRLSSGRDSIAAATATTNTRDGSGGGGGGGGGSKRDHPPTPELRHRSLGSRPFKTISPTLMKSQPAPFAAAAAAAAADKQRPFGSGERTTDEQKYRRFQEIKEEIRKRARQIDAGKAKARGAQLRAAAAPAVDLPPLSGVERAALFLNSLELHSLAAAGFLTVVHLVGLGPGIQAATALHTALLTFWVGVWLHARRAGAGARRLADYAELSRNVEVAPLAALVFYLCFAHFHRWKWYDVGIAFVIVASPPFLQWIAHSLGRATAAGGSGGRGGHGGRGRSRAANEEMDLVEVEAALRRLRVQNRARRRGPATIAIKKRRDDPPVRLAAGAEAKKNK